MFDTELIGERGSIQSIVTMVCNSYKVERIPIYGQSRKREHSEPRQIIMYCLSRFTSLSPEAIGRELHRDRTTVLYGIETVKDLMSANVEYKKKVSSIIRKIRKWQNQKKKLNT